MGNFRTVFSALRAVSPSGNPPIITAHCSGSGLSGFGTLIRGADGTNTDPSASAFFFCCSMVCRNGRASSSAFRRMASCNSCSRFRSTAFRSNRYAATLCVSRISRHSCSANFFESDPTYPFTRIIHAPFSGFTAHGCAASSIDWVAG